jgi:outer membrane protein
MIALVAVSCLAATPISLEEARDLGRRSSAAQRAELERRRAAAGADAALGALLPQVQVSGTAGGTLWGPQRYFTAIPDGAGGARLQAVDVPSSSRFDFYFGVGVSQALVDPGRWARLARASATAEAASAIAREEGLDSELEAIRRFYVLLRAQLAEDILRRRAARSEAHLERARALVESGRRGRAESLGAEINLGTDRILLLEHGARLRAAGADLVAWVGPPPSGPYQAVAPRLVESPAPVDLDAALRLANERRPLLRALEHEVRAADAAVWAGRAGGLPRLSLWAGYDRASPTADPFFTDLSRQNSVSASVNLSWLPFSGFSVEAETRAALADAERARLALAQATRDVAAEVEKAHAALAAQLGAAEVARQNTRMAGELLQLQEARFTSGVASAIDVRDAQAKLADAELAEASALIEVQVDRAALERATGALNGM